LPGGVEIGLASADAHACAGPGHPVMAMGERLQPILLIRIDTAADHNVTACVVLFGQTMCVRRALWGLASLTEAGAADWSKNSIAAGIRPAFLSRAFAAAPCGDNRAVL